MTVVGQTLLKNNNNICFEYLNLLSPICSMVTALRNVPTQVTDPISSRMSAALRSHVEDRFECDLTLSAPSLTFIRVASVMNTAIAWFAVPHCRCGRKYSPAGLVHAKGSRNRSIKRTKKKKKHPIGRTC